MRKCVGKREKKPFGANSDDPSVNAGLFAFSDKCKTAVGVSSHVCCSFMMVREWPEDVWIFTPLPRMMHLV